MIKRLFVWSDTESKIKSIVAWMLISFSLAGMWSVYRWIGWILGPDIPNHWYLDRGWLYFLSTVNVAALLAVLVQLVIVFMLREHYRGRKEIIREEIIRERTGHPDEEPFPFSHFDEVEPEANEDYHAKRQEEMMTASRLMKLLKERPPASLSEVNSMLADPYIDKVKKAKLYLLNLRRKYARQDNKKPKKEEAEVFDLTNA